MRQSMRFSKKFSISFSLFLCLSSLSAQEEVPSWVMYERARDLAQEGRIAEAIVLLEEAIDREITFPEAEYELGRLFFREGEFTLAERHLLKALAQRQYLAVEASFYPIAYTLAEVYLEERKYHEFEETLFTYILSEDESYIGERNRKNREVWTTTLKEKGLDRLLVLYRCPENASYRAHLLLSEFYGENGRMDKALEHATVGVMMVVTTLVDTIREEDYLYIFSSMEALWRKIQQEDLFLSYLEDREIYRLLYWLANALYGLAHREEAVKWWSFVAARAPEGRWKYLAFSQLREPRVAPPEEGVR
ncbi:hypothetical protein Spith_1243 [Spirochaeta thermophila DSM 6578]|uniref:Uncharacterized protein n=2 Tax=Winmispira thermophila TaxID=154 RepID=G0GEV2_WINT7|nr:hypothetical protein Spith_1243 [Spirochaeta thermophila DSM 6578]